MRQGFVILIAEDNENDAVLFRHAAESGASRAGIDVKIHRVRDGEEAIAYLSGEKIFASRKLHPFPDLIVLDLKMPLVNGLEVLKWLKAHSEFRRIPKILFSGSGLEKDVDRGYELGVNTYFEKPGSLDEYRDLVFHLIAYWGYTKRPMIRQAVGRG